jgi:hypothetical protein
MLNCPIGLSKFFQDFVRFTSKIYQIILKGAEYGSEAGMAERGINLALFAGASLARAYTA